MHDEGCEKWDTLGDYAK